MQRIGTQLVIGLIALLVVAETLTAATQLTTRRTAFGFVRPIGVVAAPGENDYIYVLEKQGRIQRVNINNGAKTLFMNIDPSVTGGTSTGDERGLLGLAFHPDYETNGFFFVNYTGGPTNNLVTRVARYSRIAGNPPTGDTGSEEILLTFSQPQSNHNGGWIHFGPEDGYLYIGTGDGGGGSDTGTGHTTATGNGQDITSNLLGKMLRIDVSTVPYTNPPDNPFVGITGDDQIWAYGLRNPWRNSFDPITGDLYIADVGQFTWEEISFQPASSTGGENYGWRCREGEHNFNFQAYCSNLTFVEPIQEYQSNGGPCSITGGEIYRGCSIPDLRGTYFYADYCSGQIWSFRYDVANQLVTEFTVRTTELAPPGLNILSITSFGRDNFGELYICDQNGGEVFKIVPAGSTESPSPNDYDNDGDVDLADMEALFNCIDEGGPQMKAPCLCDVFDNDADRDVDLASFASFQQVFP